MFFGGFLWVLSKVSQVELSKLFLTISLSETIPFLSRKKNIFMDWMSLKSRRFMYSTRKGHFLFFWISSFSHDHSCNRINRKDDFFFSFQGDGWSGQLYKVCAHVWLTVTHWLTSLRVLNQLFSYFFFFPLLLFNMITWKKVLKCPLFLSKIGRIKIKVENVFKVAYQASRRGLIH